MRTDLLLYLTICSIRYEVNWTLKVSGEEESVLVVNADLCLAVSTYLKL